MIKGYLLIKLVPGLEADALQQIRATPGILEVNLVFGQWDAIAIAEGKALFELAKIMNWKIRRITKDTNPNDVPTGLMAGMVLIG